MIHMPNDNVQALYGPPIDEEENTNIRVNESIIDTQPLYGVPSPDDNDETNTSENNVAKEENTVNENTTKKKKVNRRKNQKSSRDATEEILYGPPPPDEGRNINKNINNLDITNIALVAVLFIVGLIAIFNKKVSKKGKIIIGVIIVLAMITATIVMQVIKNK